MNRVIKYLFLISIVFITSCATKKASTIVGYNYNERTNTTKYFVLPYGSVSLPGMWLKTGYRSNSGQQFFKNYDNIKIAILFGTYDKYKFNADKSKKGLDFALAFYEWDSKYFVDTLKLQREFIEKDSINNFVIYRIFGEKEKIKYDTYFLIGIRDKCISNFSIMNTDIWSRSEKIDFLKDLYLKKSK